ncbi:MAG: cytochrome c oxidase accessory protein CcoG [Methylococcaceae bacterium]|nr:cytochrome c oxidase accessory protein CcoG [Methylococcaceae bacterium]
MTKLVDIPVKVEVYDSLSEWNVHTGDSGNLTPRRMQGKYRTLKNWGMSIWLIYFLGPYLQWDNHQAVLFDLPNQQFHFFNATLFPQDIWVLSLALLFFAILLAVITGIAGRVFCGYFCFQTVWTDMFTFIEQKLEGYSPSRRHKFKTAPWSLNKVSRSLVKHVLWLSIALLTGISFSAWFMDAFELWQGIITFTVPKPAWIAIGIFTFFTYWFAGFMREQVCFWLCPYARLQGVMYDQDTVLPAYDASRGEPRSKLRKQSSIEKGACIDCNVCVAVCPTGVDIRKGLQEGCISCGLCIDACNSIMDKIAQPRGLIRYASYKELYKGIVPNGVFKRPRVIVYSLIMLLSVLGITYGFSYLSPTEFKVVHERQPFFIKMSNGEIQNKYTLKLLNKTKKSLVIQYSISGLDKASVSGIDEVISIGPGKIIPINVFVRVDTSDGTTAAIKEFKFIANDVNNSLIRAEYATIFVSK